MTSHKLFSLLGMILLTTLLIILWGIGYMTGTTAVHIAQANPQDTVFSGTTKDTYAQEGFPNSGVGNTRNVYGGYDTIYGKQRTRIYAQFNLPELPVGATITNAQVEFYQYVTECSANYGVTAYEVTSGWEEYTLTWNAQPGVGGAVGSATFVCANGYQTVNVTGIVQNWYQGHSNNGITIWANNEYAGGGIFWARECDVTQCPGQEHPRLRIDYTVTPPTVTPTITPTSPPPPTCTVPYFSQRDPQWRNHPLRTGGGVYPCSQDCNTIGACGCTLTSGAMLFKYYEANLNPATLSDCMGIFACPFFWGVGASCSQGQAQYINKYSFSWNRLQTELNQNHRPVILGMHRGYNTHWVVVISGSSTNPADYVIHDPWPINGANMRLNSYNSWYFDWIAVYSGDTACQNLMGEVIVDESKGSTVADLTVSTNSQSGLSATETEVFNLSAYGTVTGTIELYRMTDVTMTLQIDASENATEMLVWTDNMPQTNWQPITEFVYIPVGEEIFAYFRDASGTVSEIDTDTRYPSTTPPFEPHLIFLPTVLRP